ncbi:MAG: choice-of-anchor D domain-containing protein [Kofleriaceae bacterium]|nr:choice-of-anchor D domain-containing protein [Kofleriaceae bacterium]
MKWSCVVVACVVAGCGGDDGGGGGGSDAGVGALEVSDSDGAAVESVTLAQTLVGQGSSAQLVVRNTGSAAIGPLALSITGDAANDFSLDNTLTTCAAQTLDPTESCDIVLKFRPTAAGERTADLAIASTSGTPVHVGLIGHAVMPSLHFDPPTASFGQLEIGPATQMTLELVNDGTVDAPIDAIAVSGAGFARGASTCGATLAAGTSCDIVLTATPQALGLVSGNLTVTSAGVDYSAAATAHGARRVTVTKTGTGSGTITSTPAGINCGSTCTALFESAITLTAAPGANTQITSWSIPSCGTAATCTVPADITPASVTVSMTLSGSSEIAIVYAGSATGEVKVFESGAPVATCFGSCSVPVTAGNEVAIEASTPSTLTSVSGACTSSPCLLLSAPVGTSTVTFTFNKDSKEQWTRFLPGDIPTAAAFDASGNLVVGSPSNLIKLAPAGSTLWTLSMPVSAIATGPSDTIYVRTDNSLVKLDSSGTQLWSVTPAVGACVGAHDLAVASDGSVVARGNTGVARWDAGGTASWTKTLSGDDHHCSVAIDASGNVLADVPDADTGEATDVKRWASDGTALADLTNASAGYHAMITTNAAGLIACASGHSRAYLVGPGISASKTTTSADYVQNSCTAAGTGDVGWLYRLGGVTGWRVARYLANGTSPWQLETFGTAGESSSYGPMASTLAGSSTGRLAVVGSYKGVATASETAWVQVYDP